MPVRPNPVATSSQISSTSCVAARRRRARANALGRRELHARGALHERLDDHRGELVARARATIARRALEAVGVVEAGRAQHREPERREQVGAEAAVADGERADGVAVVRAAEREERRAAR